MSVVARDDDDGLHYKDSRSDLGKCGGIQIGGDRCAARCVHGPTLVGGVARVARAPVRSDARRAHDLRGIAGLIGYAGDINASMQSRRQIIAALESAQRRWRHLGLTGSWAYSPALHTGINIVLARERADYEAILEEIEGRHDEYEATSE